MPISFVSTNASAASTDNISFTSISANNGLSLALTKTGEVYQWGSPLGVNLGAGDPSSVIFEPTLVEGLPKITKIASSGSGSFALSENGEVYAWGLNWLGNLGLSDVASTPGISMNTNETTAIVSEPMKITSLKDIVNIWPGTSYTYAMDKSGDIYVWGYDRGRYIDLKHGLDGSDEKSNHIYSTPYKILHAPDTVEIAVGYTNAFAVVKDGSVYAWGLNGHGSLGVGKTSEELLYSADPIKIEGLSDIVSISAGMDQALATDKNGNVYAWGSQYGLLPYEVNADVTSPVKVEGLSNIVKTASYSSQLALDASGNAFIWGYGGNHGKTASIENGYFTKLTPVPGLDGVVTDIANTGSSSIFLTDYGSIFEWGVFFSENAGPGLNGESDEPSDDDGDDEEDLDSVSDAEKFAAENIVMTDEPVEIFGNSTVTVAAPAPKSAGPNVGLIILIIVLILLIIGGVAFFIFIKKTGKNPLADLFKKKAPKTVDPIALEQVKADPTLGAPTNVPEVPTPSVPTPPISPIAPISTTETPAETPAKVPAELEGNTSKEVPAELGGNTSEETSAELESSAPKETLELTSSNVGNKPRNDGREAAGSEGVTTSNSTPAFPVVSAQPLPAAPAPKPVPTVLSHPEKPETPVIPAQPVPTVQSLPGFSTKTKVD